MRYSSHMPIAVLCLIASACQPVTNPDEGPGDGGGGGGGGGGVFTPPGSIALSPGQYDILVGEEFGMGAVVSRSTCDALACGPQFPTSEPVSWRSSKPEVASISDGGGVRGLAPGVVTVTATAAGGTSASARVRVATTFLALGALAANRFRSCGLAANGAAYCWPERPNFNPGFLPPSGIMPAARFAPDMRFSLISIGWFHGCAILLDGRAVCYGDRSLGRGLDLDPAEVGGDHRFATLSVNPGGGVYYDRSYVCGADRDGLAWCWGDNDKGQLGTTEALPTRTPDRNPNGGAPEPIPYAPLPVRVAGNGVFRHLSAGNRHTCGLTVGGSVLCWGANETGQLGDGSTVDRPTPVAVAIEGEVEQVVAGADFTCARRQGGDALCWGGNGQGQLGQGDRVPRLLPVAVSGGVLFTTLAVGQVACGLDGGGRAWCWGGVGPGATWGDVPTVVAGEAGLSGLSVGSDHACAVRPTGRVVCWGSNENYQLGSAGGSAVVPRPISGPIAP